MVSASLSHVFRGLQPSQNLPDDHSGEGIRNISVNTTPPHPQKFICFVHGCYKTLVQGYRKWLDIICPVFRLGLFWGGQKGNPSGEASGTFF